MGSKYQPGIRVSEYLLEECLGAGTFGEVWQARHHIWDSERVAIKLPTEPEYVRFLQREGVVVHGLRHPNIIRVIGLDPYAEIPYLVMELVRGPSLREVIRAHDRGLPIGPTIIVLRGLLRAMAAAHGAGTVHRDLKPGNVLLHLEDRSLDALAVDHVKVGDFGLGVGDADALRSMIEQSASIARDEQRATLAGTLAYMAPEVRDGQRLPDSRSDLYSIGVILFEMATGGRPAGAELPSTLRADWPATLDEVFRRLYARYENRYPSADAVLADLEARLEPARRRAGVDRSESGPTAPIRVEPCPRCGERAVNPGDQFCTHCGKQVAKVVRRCPWCAGYPGPDDRFCIFCGEPLGAAE